MADRRADGERKRKKPLKLGGRFGKPLRVGNHTLTIMRKRSDDFTVEIQQTPTESPENPQTAIDGADEVSKNQ